MLKRSLAVFALAAVTGAATPAHADDFGKDPALLTLFAGAFDIFGEAPGCECDRSFHGGLQYRSDYELWILKPHAGFFVVNSGTVYGWGGLLIDLDLHENIVATASTAAGYWFENGGHDLGFELEFRSAFELAYRFEDRSRLGIGISHTSNARLGDKNSGPDHVFLSYSVPVERIFGD